MAFVELKPMLRTWNIHGTISRSFPDAATRFRLSHSSEGMGVRFQAYAIDGPYEDLIRFALTEFESYQKGIEVTVADDSKSPFDAEQMFFERSYSVHLDLLSTAEHSRGTVVSFAGRHSSHMPLIFYRQNCFRALPRPDRLTRLPCAADEVECIAHGFSLSSDHRVVSLGRIRLIALS